MHMCTYRNLQLHLTCLELRLFTLAFVVSFFSTTSGLVFSFKGDFNALAFLIGGEDSELTDGFFTPNFSARSLTLFVEGQGIEVSSSAEGFISCGTLTIPFTETLFS